MDILTIIIVLAVIMLSIFIAMTAIQKLKSNDKYAKLSSDKPSDRNSTKF